MDEMVSTKEDQSPTTRGRPAIHRTPAARRCRDMLRYRRLLGASLTAPTHVSIQRFGKDARRSRQLLPDPSLQLRSLRASLTMMSGCELCMPCDSETVRSGISRLSREQLRSARSHCRRVSQP